MKHNAFTRILSMILAICTVISMSTAALATEAVEPEIPAETIVETQPVETEPVETEPVETEPVETEPVETEPVETEPVETEPVETEPVETEPAETEPEETVPEESVPEETVPEDTEPEETAGSLPYGLKGMPEGYVLSEEALGFKAELTEFGVVKAAANLKPGKDYVEDEIIVGAEDEAEAQLIAEAYNGTLLKFNHGLALIRLETISVAEAVALSADMHLALPAASVNEIVRLNPVKLEEKERDVSAKMLPERQTWETWVKDTMDNPDPYLLDPEGYENYYQWHHDVVDTYAGWGVSTGRAQINIAVLDTGVRGSHTELSGRVDYLNIGLGTADGDGHGTHVAGLIAAAMDNGYGGAGIAPKTRILSVKVLDDDGYGDSYDIMQGMLEACYDGAEIINMSLGGYIYDPYYNDVCKYIYNCGTTIIAAMGNDSSNVKCYPAAYSKYVIAVGATDPTNNRAFFSNWGSWQDVSAPGYGMRSTYSASDNSYTTMSGTSQATPVVAGLAAMYMSANGYVSPATMEKVLEGSCVKGGSNLGKGIVNAANMFSKNKPTVKYDVYDYEGWFYTSTTVPCDAYLSMYSSTYADENGTLIYNVNSSKSPSVKDGEILNGTQTDGFIRLEQYAGKTITVKARAVNGVGIAGPVKTIKLKVSTSPAVTGVSIDGPTYIVSGKSVTLKATVSPAKASQSVTWRIVNRYGMSSAKIDSKGKLTTSSKQEGYVVIQATSKTNQAKTATIVVTTEKMKPVASMALNRTSATLTLGTSNSANARTSLYITKMVDSAKQPINPYDSGVKWSSSKTSVARVDQDGNVTAVGPGSATITCKTLDGSGKSASCKITVKQLLTYITVNGQQSMSPGSTVTFKTTSYPSYASNKAVNWYLSGAPAGTKIDSKGKVTLPKSAPVGSSFYVIAIAKDGSGQWGRAYVEIWPKCTGLNAYYEEHDSRLVKTNSSGQITSAVLYTYDDDYYDGYDTGIQLYVFGKNVTPEVIWTSSNPSVARVDYDCGYVEALKAGTAKITATAQDGSGKKVTVTITVRNPVSSMSIKSSALRSYGDDAYLAFGKSATNKVTFADTYGTVSNKAVKWDFGAYEYDSNGNYVADWTYYFKANKLASIDSKGVLKTSKKIEDQWGWIESDFLICVWATSVDNPSVSASHWYYLIPPTTKMYAIDSKVTVLRNDIGYADIYCDMWNPEFDPYTFELTATSSNPDIVGAISILPYANDYGEWDYEYRHRYSLIFSSGTKKGTATITVKAGDGSGKYCKVKITVK